METDKKKKNIFGKIINIILWIVVMVLVVVVLTDFTKVNSQKEPVFCISEGETKYDDGVVKWCKGFGYKVYYYKRECMNAIEFGPFWIKDRSLEENKCK